MSTPTARELWVTALGTLQTEVNRHNYDTWLRNTTGLELAGTLLTVGVPNEFVAKGLERRLSAIILKTLRELTDADLEVRYLVHQPAAAHEPAFMPLPRNGAATQAPARPRPPMRMSHLNPAYTFESFVVGKSNRLAHAAAMAVAERPGRAYNPLFIHSGVGLGKTHLLQAIGHFAAGKGMSVLFASAEQFTNDFVSALRENRTDAFRDRYRSTDFLLIDDIQFIAGKEHSKESFFHTFNELHGANKQIVITSDSRPTAIPLMEDRLRSRFEGGLTADIQLPELETRHAILQAKAQRMGVHLDPAVIDFLARKVVRNVRELEGALNRLLVMAGIMKQQPTLELAQQAIADGPAANLRRNDYAPSSIISTVAAYFHLTPSVLSGPTRTKEIAHARQVAAYLIREETTYSLSDAGRLLGNRGHTTILRAHAKVAADIEVDATLRHEIGEIRAKLGAATYSSG